MSKTLVHKNDVNFNAVNGDQKKITSATEKFVNDTNIKPKAVFTKAFLLTLKANKDAFILDNITPTSNTSGKVKCDKVFADKMKERKETSFSQRVKKSGKWNVQNWWCLLSGSVLLAIALIWFQPHSKQFNAEDKQFETAKEMIQNGWDNAIVPGPLYINLNDWKASRDNYEKIQSLISLKDSLTKKANEYGNSIRESAQQEINKITGKVEVVKSRIKDSLHTVAQSIIDKALDSLKKNKAAKSYVKSEKDRADLLLKTDEPLAKIANVEYLKQIAFLKTQVENKYLPDSTITKKISSITFPTSIEYPYDLLAEDTPTITSGWWKFGMWACIVVGGIIVVVFLYFVIILFQNLEKKSKENIQYYSDTLRTMAFPGKHSVPNGDSTCDINFNSMTTETKQLLQSVLVRYPWNVLTSGDAYEFEGILKNSEQLNALQKDQAPEPMFFVYEGDLVIVYAGLNEVEETKQPIVLEPFKEKLSEDHKDRTM